MHAINAFDGSLLAPCADGDTAYCQTVSEGGIYSGFLPEVRLIAWSES
jgi:hypothetical protein